MSQPFHAPAAEAAAEPFNIAQYLPRMALSAPERPAVIRAHAPDDRGRTRLTFAELDRESDVIARGVSALGLAPGMRVLLMLRPGLDFVTLAFSLFKAGAIPVLIDPGMGGRNLLNCIRQSRPRAVIGLPLLHAIRVLCAPDAFDSSMLNITVGRRWFWGGPTLDHARKLGGTPLPRPAPQMAATTRDSDAAILFTTGSTGIPKGVLYKHGMFDAQVRAIRERFQIMPGEVDLPAFPLFALFSTALGTTCVIPDMDPTRPAHCDPQKIVSAIQRESATYSFGSPSIWKRVGPYCEKNSITLPGLKRILMAGAPVRGDVLAPFKNILPNGDTFIPYGATEALPVSVMRGSEVLSETWAKTRAGLGHCVGKPLPGVTVKIIRPDAVSGAAWDNAFVLPDGEIGEIVVKGPMVTREYFDMPEQTAAAKLIETPILKDSAPAFWHRMGDMGYVDPEGRLWFCGRKAHRVSVSPTVTLHSVCCEAVYERSFEKILGPLAPRAALVGIGEANHQTAAIVFESKGLSRERLQALSKVREHLADQPAAIRGIRYLLGYPGGFPVDVRHNAKIDREKLGQWAAARLRHEIPNEREKEPHHA
jgi:acyl-CoA synthetase (AMP-forming)/AMP-acid ligase II